MLELNAILFDVDGTLVKPDEALKMTWKISLQKMELPLLDNEVIEKSVGEVVQVTFQKYFPQYGDVSEEFVRNFRETYRKIPCKYFTPISGAVETLYELKKNMFNLGIVANKERAIINHVLGCVGLSEIFSEGTIISLDDGCKPKPSNEPVEKAVEKMNLNKHYTAIVGDHVYDVIAGKTSEIKTIAVLTGTGKYRDFEQYNPDLILNSVTEIRKYVSKV